MDCFSLHYRLTTWCPGQNARSQERIRTQVHRTAREGNPKRDHAGDREEKLQPVLWILQIKLAMWPRGTSDCRTKGLQWLTSCFSALPSLYNLRVGKSGSTSCHCDTDLLPLWVTDTEESRTYRFSSCPFISLSYGTTSFLLYTANCISMDLSLQVYKQEWGQEAERKSYLISSKFCCFHLISSTLVHFSCITVSPGLSPVPAP